MSDHLKFYINGEWVDSLGSETIEVFNPSDESVIGSIFKGKVEAVTRVGNLEGIIPSITGSARITGHSQLILDPEDPYVKGFQVL